MSPRRGAAGISAIARSSGRLLLLRRSLLVPKPGTWSCPGGGIEAGEPPLQAALREFGEETGYSGLVEVLGELPSRSGFHHFVAVIPGEFLPQLNWENDRAAWFARGQWPHPLHPGMAAALRRLERA